MTKEILCIIALCIILVGVVLYITIKAIQKNWINKIYNTMKEAIKYAETSGKVAKEDKKEYVLEQIRAKCVELKIPYKLIVAVISKLINLIIEHYNVISK